MAEADRPMTQRMFPMPEEDEAPTPATAATPGAPAPAAAAGTPTPTAEPAAAVCPYLGLRTDPATHFAFPSTAQACHAGGRARSVDAGKQARDCLTDDHVACPWYRPPVAPATPVVTGSVTLAGGDDDGRPRRSGIRILVYVLLFVAMAVAGLTIGFLLASSGAGAAGGGESAPAAAGSPTMGAAPTPEGPSIAPATTPAATPVETPATSATSATPTASPALTASPAPTASAGAATGTPRPSASPSAVRHKVAAGETLSSIAARYGVTVAAIVKANGLKDANHILVGQRLLIPTP